MESIQQPETMILAWTAIKVIIDVFGWLIPSYLKRPIAVLLWLAWAFAFLDAWLDTTLFFWLTTGASAIGINELASKKKDVLVPVYPDHELTAEPWLNVTEWQIQE